MWFLTLYDGLRNPMLFFTDSVTRANWLTLILGRLTKRSASFQTAGTMNESWTSAPGTLARTWRISSK